MNLQDVLSGEGRVSATSKLLQDIKITTSNEQIDILEFFSVVPNQNFCSQRRLMRSMDIFVSSVVLFLLLPLAAAITLIVKFNDKGPVLYRQERLGLHGKPFMLLKFRSMHVDAEASGPVWASVRDPRVTWIGAILRLTRLDELPQLWNILTGDMTLVGPRPERPIFAELLTNCIPNFQFRVLVKPGLTGWAQVNLPYSSSVDDARNKLLYDLYYIKNASVLFNMLILIKTFKVIALFKGR